MWLGEGEVGEFAAGCQVFRPVVTEGVAGESADGVGADVVHGEGEGVGAVSFAEGFVDLDAFRQRQALSAVFGRAV